MTVTALIVAAGSGSRMGGELPKQYRRLAGKSVLAHAVDALASHPGIDAVRVVIGEGQKGLAQDALGARSVGDLIVGGAERGLSVRAGIAAIDDDIALIHDAARPFCPPAVIDRLLDALEEYDAATPVMPATDTLTRLGDRATLGERVERQEIFRVQTPQAFRLAALRRAIEDWRGAGPSDETAYLKAMGISVAAIEGHSMLDKLTTPEVFARAEAVMMSRMVGRTGTGFDVHAFAGN